MPHYDNTSLRAKQELGGYDLALVIMLNKLWNNTIYKLNPLTSSEHEEYVLEIKITDSEMLENFNVHRAGALFLW